MLPGSVASGFLKQVFILFYNLIISGTILSPKSPPPITFPALAVQTESLLDFLK